MTNSVLNLDEYKNIGRNKVLYLNKDDYEKLLTGKKIKVKDKYFANYFGKGHRADTFLRILVFKDGNEDVFSEFHSTGDIDYFLDNTVLGAYYPRSRKVTLLDEKKNSIRDLIQDSKSFISKDNLYSVLFNSLTIRTNIGGDFVTKEFINKFKVNLEYKGLISCCECGEPMCGSTYVWIDQGIIKVLVSASAGVIKNIQILPFKMV